MGILQKTYRRHITFDPASAEHRRAYWQLRQSGKQDADLRFILEEGFSSVLTMMQARIADHFSRPVEAESSNLFLFRHER